MNTNFNLVINIAGTELQMALFEERLLSKKGAEVEIVNVKSDDLHGQPNEKIMNLLSKIDVSSRIYIVDHGTPNSSNISSAHYSELANYLAHGLDKNKINNKKQKLKISLICCNTGIGNENSFAGLFHRYMGQIKHLDVDVLARTRVVAIGYNAHKLGKTTASLLEYGFTQMTYDLGFHSLSKLLAMDESAHQVPGSKVTFKWDSEGQECIVDSYMDKLFKDSVKISKNILKSIKDNPELLEKLSSDFIEILKIDKKFDRKEIDNLINCLKNVKNELKKMEVEGRDVLIDDINKLIKLGENSIGFSSFEMEKLWHFITDSGKDLKNVNKYIKEEIYKPVLNLLKKISKENDQVESATQDFLQIAGNAISWKMKNNLQIEKEIAVVQYIKDSLEVVLSGKFSETEKFLELNLLQEKIECFIKDDILISEAVKGALEGVQHALSYGGLTALKLLLPSIQGFSKYESNLITSYFDQIHQFKLSLDIYVSSVENALVEEAIQGATNIAKMATQPMNKALDFSYEIIATNKKKKDKIKECVNSNKQIIKLVEIKLEKLKRSLEFSADERVKQVTISYAVNPIQEKLDNLKLVTKQLKSMLK